MMVSFLFIFALVLLLQPNQSASSWQFFVLFFQLIGGIFFSKVLKNHNTSELQELLDAYI